MAASFWWRRSLINSCRCVSSVFCSVRNFSTSSGAGCAGGFGPGPDGRSFLQPSRGPQASGSHSHPVRYAPDRTWRSVCVSRLYGLKKRVVHGQSRQGRRYALNSEADQQSNFRKQDDREEKCRVKRIRVSGRAGLTAGVRQVCGGGFGAVALIGGFIVRRCRGACESRDG